MAGERGPQGDPGARGDHGQPGEHGEPGIPGETGEIGETGVTGDTGDTGKRGERGPRGDVGSTGVGVPGSRGEQGRQGEQGESTMLSRHTAGSFMALVALFAVTLGVFGYFIRHNHRLAVQGNQAHAALCIFKADLIRRADDGARFLKEHPNGIPGIKVGVIRESVKNQRKTIVSLDDLHCP